MFVWLFVLSLLIGKAPAEIKLPVASLPTPKVVLITIDGVRYLDVFNGADTNRSHFIPPERIMPNLYHYFMGHGVVVGKLSPMVASGPNYMSLPGYLEITRGHKSWDCTTNDCNPIIDRSILQLFNTSAVFGSWIGIGKTAPPNYTGVMDVGKPFYRWDSATELAAVSYLSNHSPDFLWVALGDTDELAHQDNYPRYLDALHSSDAFIGSLIAKDDGNTTWIITVDHGRNPNFKDHGPDPHCARVWAALYGRGIPTLGFVRADGASLSDIYDTILGLQWGAKMGLLDKVRP